MLSPMQRHRIKTQTLNEMQPKDAVSSASTSLHILNEALKKDVLYLRSLPTKKERVEEKRNVLLPRWQPYAQSYVEQGEVYRNPIFSYCIVWLFDVGDFDLAIKWAIIAIQQNQPTPENIKRYFPAFVADQIYEWAEQQAYQGNTIEPYFSMIFNKIVNEWRVHEEIKSKWYKFAGLFVLRDENGKPRATAIDDIEVLEKADQLLAQAEALHVHAQVKTMRASIASRIRALSDPDYTQPQRPLDEKRDFLNHLSNSYRALFKDSHV